MSHIQGFNNFSPFAQNKQKDFDRIYRQRKLTRFVIWSVNIKYQALPTRLRDRLGLPLNTLSFSLEHGIAEQFSLLIHQELTFPFAFSEVQRPHLTHYTNIQNNHNQLLPSTLGIYEDWVTIFAYNPHDIILIIKILNFKSEITHFNIARLCELSIKLIS